MASIQSLGVGSGLLTSELVEDIISAEREATDLRLDARRAEVQAKISAYGSVRSGIDALISASGALAEADNILLNTVSSNNPAAVTATADATAQPNIHTVEVLATARAHALTTGRYDSIDDVVGEGTIDIRFGTTTFNAGNYDTFTENTERAAVSLTIDSSNSTLAGIRDAINAANLGVNANVVDDGQGFVLVLTSDRTGEAHSMEITVTEGAVSGLSALDFNATNNTPGTNLTQTVDADDASVTIDGTTVTRETNVIEGVVAGVTFTALASNAGVPATVSVNQDTSAITERLQAFVDSYNSLKTLTDELTDFNEDEGIGALLTGDATLRTLLSQVRRDLFGSVDNVASGALRALVELGINSDDANNFLLSLSTSKVVSALQSNPDQVVALLAEQTRASDSQIEVLGFTSATQAGSYAVDITQAAAQAAYTGAVVAGLAGSVTIDDDSDTLAVTVDGVSSGTITLTQGVYADGAALATQLEAQINQDANLSDAGAKVEVNYDADTQQLVLSSQLYGSASSIGIDAVDTDTTSKLGLSLSSASNNVGVDVTGTINGVEGTGIGQFLGLLETGTEASSGVYKGAAVTTFETLPVTIDTSNDEFRVSVDGILSNTITLTAGSYADADAVATELQTQINADTTLQNSGLSVAVAWDAANQRFAITSASEGTESTVNVTFAEAGTVSDLGLAVGIGTPGKEASELADAAGGIQILVQGNATGERGTVTLVRGVMNKLNALLQNFVGFEGTLTTRTNGLQNQISEINTESAEFERRMNVLEERLRIQFAAADALISTLNNTSSFLDQQLASLPGFSRDSG